MREMDKIRVTLVAVLGENIMPLHQLLRISRGSVIALNRDENDLVRLYAGDVKVALGNLEIDRDKVLLRLVKLLSPSPVIYRRPDTHDIKTPEGAQAVEAKQSTGPDAPHQAD